MGCFETEVFFFFLYGVNWYESIKMKLKIAMLGIYSTNHSTVRTAVTMKLFCLFHFKIIFEIVTTPVNKTKISTMDLNCFSETRVKIFFPMNVPDMLTNSKIGMR